MWAEPTSFHLNAVEGWNTFNKAFENHSLCSVSTQGNEITAWILTLLCSWLAMPELHTALLYRVDRHIEKKPNPNTRQISLKLLVLSLPRTIESTATFHLNSNHGEQMRYFCSQRTEG